MRIIDMASGRSPESSGATRLSVRLEVDTRSAVLDYWVDVPAWAVDGLPDRDDAWAVLMTPLASYFDEPISLERPVDRWLLDNLRSASLLWSKWSGAYRSVDFVAPNRVNSDRAVVTSTPGGEPSGHRTLGCFSGGVDSWFTMLRHAGAALGDSDRPIDDLLTVAGFNSPIHEVEQMVDYVSPIAEHFGFTHVPVTTNLRYGDHSIDTPYSVTHWMVKVSHGAFLAFLAHLLGDRYDRLLIPATASYRDGIKQIGSNPALDPLFSSSELRIIHEGALYERTERIEWVGQSDYAMSRLQVCWQGFELGNCSRCEKCIRTMAMIDALGLRGEAASFDWSAYSMKAISGVVLNHDVALQFDDLRRAAHRAGRSDIAAAASRALERAPLRRARNRAVAPVKRFVFDHPTRRRAYLRLRGVDG